MSRQRKYDYGPVRVAYMSRTPAPTYAELGEEFGLPANLVGRVALDEAWPIRRAEMIESRLREANAGQVILEAVTINRALTQAAASFGLKMFQKISETMDKMKETNAASTDAQVLNCLTFAAANTARALKDVGIAGLPKELADAGKEANGKWNPKLLTAINLTIQNLVQKAEPKESAELGDKTPPALQLGTDRAPSPPAG